MNESWYIGSGSYCYANATAMLLGSIGENVSPSLIEALTGVGLSASSPRAGGLLFFNYQPLLPDLGISKALDLLGFAYQVHVSQGADDYPTDTLRAALRTGGAVIGPVDMGYLPYNPHSRMVHADHYLFAYAADDRRVYLHDPAGYPHVFADWDAFREAWQAEVIGYRQGYYRFLWRAERVSNPSEDEIERNALEWYRQIYRRQREPDIRAAWLIGKEAVDALVERAQVGALEDGERGHLIYFALPLGAKRANDFALFFRRSYPELCELKLEQSRWFGAARTYLVMGQLDDFASALGRLGNLEEDFVAAL